MFEEKYFFPLFLKTQDPFIERLFGARYYVSTEDTKMTHGSHLQEGLNL